MTRRIKQVNRTEQRRRSQRFIEARVVHDLFDRRRVTGEHVYGTVGRRLTDHLPEYTHLQGRRVIEASVGAVALVGTTPGWRHPRTYLGLHANPARRSG